MKIMKISEYNLYFSGKLSLTKVAMKVFGIFWFQESTFHSKLITPLETLKSSNLTSCAKRFSIARKNIYTMIRSAYIFRG